MHMNSTVVYDSCESAEYSQLSTPRVAPGNITVKDRWESGSNSSGRIAYSRRRT